jgi:hypothetical protein
MFLNARIFEIFIYIGAEPTHKSDENYTFPHAR